MLESFVKGDDVHFTLAFGAPTEFVEGVCVHFLALGVEDILSVREWFSFVQCITVMVCIWWARCAFGCIISRRAIAFRMTVGAGVAWLGNVCWIDVGKKRVLLMLNM